MPQIFHHLTVLGTIRSQYKETVQCSALKLSDLHVHEFNPLQINNIRNLIFEEEKKTDSKFVTIIQFRNILVLPFISHNLSDF